MQQSWLDPKTKTDRSRLATMSQMLRSMGSALGGGGKRQQGKTNSPGTVSRTKRHPVLLQARKTKLDHFGMKHIALFRSSIRSWWKSMKSCSPGSLQAKVCGTRTYTTLVNLRTRCRPWLRRGRRRTTKPERENLR